jgi:hypothetical protein
MMYVNTNIVHARAQKGWWRAVTETVIKHKLEYDPARLGSSGGQSLRRWANKGYCDRPTGEHAAYWQMHMWNARATYIAKLYSSFAEIVFLDSDHARALKNDEIAGVFKAKLLLISASSNQTSKVYMTGPDRITNHDMMELTGTGLQSCSLVTLRRNGWGASVRSELEALINEIGRPLSDDSAAKFRLAIKRPLTLNVTVSDEYKQVKPGDFEHRTITRITR